MGDARIGLIKSSENINYQKAFSASSPLPPKGQSASFLISTLNSFHGVLVSDLSG